MPDYERNFPEEGHWGELMDAAIAFGDRMRALGKLEGLSKHEDVAADDLRAADKAAAVAWSDILVTSNGIEFPPDAAERIAAAGRFDDGPGPFYLRD